METELTRRLKDLYSRTSSSNRICSTAFLDPAEIAQAEDFIKFLPDANCIFIGGYENPERSRLFFLPDYIDKEDFPTEEHIHAIKITCSFGKPTHRDYLGSLMGLGIKRETIGDILISDNCAYIVCTPQISGFITDNLVKIGRLGVKCTRCPLGEIHAVDPEYEVVSGTVATLRVDAAVGLAFSISRTKAAELIADGCLSINHREQLSPSATLCEGDLLSMRGFGRARLASIGGLSKKGRQFLEFFVYSKK